MIFFLIAYIIQLVLRGVAQVVERYFREVEAASSSLVTPTQQTVRTSMVLTVFCYGDEENDHRTWANEHLTTTNQSEIRKAYLISVMATRKMIFAGECHMINKENFHVFNYVKKEEYTASMDGMRYMLKKKDTDEGAKLEVIIWPQPYCYAKTPEEKKQRTTFEFSPAGVEKAADWLNEQYTLQRPLWELSKKLNII